MKARSRTSVLLAQRGMVKCSSYIVSEKSQFWRADVPIYYCSLLYNKHETVACSSLMSR